MRNYWLAARTKRHHTAPTIGEQNLADHSWGVAKILLEIWPDSRVELVKVCLDHDLLEHITGDLPATVKWAHPGLAEALDSVEQALAEVHGLMDYELYPHEQNRLKAADMLEFLMFCVYQLNLGNSFYDQLYRNGYDYITKLSLKFSEADRDAVFDFLERHING